MAQTERREDDGIYQRAKKRYLSDPLVPCEICGAQLPAPEATWMLDETACCPSCHPDRAKGGEDDG